MCGIVGRVLRPEAVAAETVFDPTRIVERLHHRGPDAQGQFKDGFVWLGHTRLSILDLSLAGSQPMVTGDGRFVICYNGEVYNFAELARSLALQDLRSHSDTEVILMAFAKLGIAAAIQLNGMFAFALYDRGQQKLWLVRDRLGIKPLYYRIGAGGLTFASEIKALLAMDAALPQCDISSLHEWLFYGASLGARTLYRGIQKLLPGYYLELDVRTFAVRTQPYWSVAQQSRLPTISLSDAELTREIRRRLEEAVKRQLVSDVPVGIFLSGGIDSTAITALASRHYAGRLATYSAGFDFDRGVNELPQAREVARLYGTDHHELHVTGVAIADVVEKMVEHHDMPFSDAANIPLYLMASQISGGAKVVLQGDGGDELFGGYRRYATLSFQRLLRPLAKWGGWINTVTPRTAHHYRRRRYLNALAADDQATMMALLLTEEDRESPPSEIFAYAWRQQIKQYDPFARYRECQGLFAEQDVVNQMALVDSMIILPDIFLEKVDRSTMAASLEVRVPFLDNELVDLCLRIPGYRKVSWGRKKWLLKKALHGVVPRAVLSRKKTGFGVPFGYWLRGALKPMFFDHLEQFQRIRPGVLNGQTIGGMYQEHASGRRDRSFLLWKLLNFMVWANRGTIQFRL